VTATIPSVDVARLATRLRSGVWRLARRMRTESHVDLSPTLHAALGTIARHEPMTAGDFARHEQIRKPTATRTLATLEELGLLERTPDPLDGRVAWLRLSTEGRRVVQAARRRHDAFLAGRIKRLSAEDQSVLARAAEILEGFVEDPAE
jgi:DNA-binding MarR family transcriptional regulator